ncbi:MAG: histidine kinase [Betaproteobacteria bacterium RIFCSPLOWO2_02_64_14]|nr:MAG: histidine kinase [Betaproteobacteria bacterium RIFCSPLOWO2_02_64_14]
MSASINHKTYASALPNFRNLGVLLRILVIVNVMAAGIAVSKSGSLTNVWHEVLEVSAVVQPVIMLSLVTLVLLNDVLRRAPYLWGASIVLALELVLVTALYVFGRPLFAMQADALEAYWLLTLLVTAALLLYFDLRGRALSPALSEARLQALQARIRPHFLFNSINAVLSLIRQDPKRAERALEDMADLFRALMADNRQLAPLAREVELCREYLNIEQLRLGERLRIEWHVDNLPQDALIPPLVLQPLLENAVYHGIEPRLEPGVVSINIYLARGEVHMVLRNPYEQEGDHHAGNKMALANIRERLALHFDAEASLTTNVSDSAYQVHIVVPYQKAGAA